MELPDPPNLFAEVYSKATVVSVQGDKVTLKYGPGESGPPEIRGDYVFSVNDYSKLPNGYNDMVDMENLSEAELLYNMKIRYEKDMIFTYIGPTLLIINPGRKIDELYTEEVFQKFQIAAVQSSYDPRNFMPHEFGISAETMVALFENQKNQAIVISGESGSGKTENARGAMALLTSTSITDI